jgi:hypothetical protein
MERPSESLHGDIYMPMKAWHAQGAQVAQAPEPPDLGAPDPSDPSPAKI